MLFNVFDVRILNDESFLLSFSVLGLGITIVQHRRSKQMDQISFFSISKILLTMRSIAASSASVANAGG